MNRAWKKKNTRLQKVQAVTLLVCVVVFTIVLPLLKVEPGDNFSTVSSNENINKVVCTTRLMYVTVSGGINNQILATVNALALAKYLNLTLVVPTFQKLRTSRPVSFDPVPLSTYFNEKVFIERALKLGITVLPFSTVEKSTTLEIPASTGRNFHDIIDTIQEGLESGKNCNIEVLNQWGIRWPRSTPTMYEYLNVFEYNNELMAVAKAYKDKYLNFSYIAVHARVEDTSPSVYFNSDFEKGRKDEIKGILQHLENISLELPIYVASGVNCKSDVFQSLRDAGYQLHCIDAFHPFFSDDGTESYVKSCVDTIVDTIYLLIPVILSEDMRLLQVIS